MSRRARTELLLFAAAYALYNLARGVAIGSPAEAARNAGWIVHVERAAGVDVERAVQRALDQPVLACAFSYVYLSAQFVVLPLTLIWLFRSAPRIYRVLRNAVLATWALAVPIFTCFPVTPPRLAGIGIADTVSRQAAVTLTGRSTVLYNQLAAVPSLHVGFAVAVSVALAVALRAPVLRLAAAAWGPLVAVTVIATGNHYLFDVATGVLTTAGGATIAAALARRETSRRLVPSPC